jgi:aryl-alcohol dehydrogenase-like predicted oxidoreductase
LRKIGALDVSVIGLGTNNFGTDFFGTSCDLETSKRVIDAALDAGVTFIDTAEEYSTTTSIGTGRSEEFIGTILGARRNEAVIATKFSVRVPDAPGERGAARIMRAVEGSLRRLRTDRIDLLQQHSPDPDVPIDEILEALTRLVRDGKVREIGCSNFTAAMIDQARAAATPGAARFVSVQNPYNLLDSASQADVLDACARHDMAILPCFPLASGLLTGKYSGDQAPPADSRFGGESKVIDYLRQLQYSDARLATVERLKTYASEHGHSLLELAISWLTSQPHVASVIAGATRPDQVRANVDANCWKLSQEDFAAVAAIIAPDPS